MSKNTERILERLRQIKAYALEGSEQAAEIIVANEGDIVIHSFYSGKIAAYNDVYDWIENVLEGEENEKL
ncbi:MAG: hypothetical protein J6T34_00290 [Bacilli bacterium]|nr:hypothetical protein [Bacilli bacterium]